MQVLFLKEYKMKKIIAIILATFALATFAAEPSQPTTAPDGMKLAKKKDHSKDTKVDATKSPTKSAPAKDAKAPTKTDGKSTK
jgi:Ni/Co efflux regulator RcnB